MTCHSSMTIPVGRREFPLLYITPATAEGFGAPNRPDSKQPAPAHLTSLRSGESISLTHSTDGPLPPMVLSTRMKRGVLCWALRAAALHGRRCGSCKAKPCAKCTFSISRKAGPQLTTENTSTTPSMADIGGSPKTSSSPCASRFSGLAPLTLRTCGPSAEAPSYGALKTDNDLSWGRTLPACPPVHRASEK